MSPRSRGGKAPDAIEVVAEQAGLDAQRPERIDRNQMQRAPARNAHVHVERRARDVDAGQRCDPRIDLFVEAAERAADDEIGVARERARSGREFIDR